MKNILRYTAALFYVVLALTSCLPEEPVHESINMGAGEVTSLSSSAADLLCEIEDELPKYTKIEYGIIYSDNQEKVENHKGVKKIEGRDLSENRFLVQLTDLKAKQEYFYSSYLRLDEGRIIYGDISSFVTKASYKVTFNANGGKGGMEPQHFEEDDNKALTENTFTREGHEFAGWNTKADGSGQYFHPQQAHLLTDNVNLFAQWQVISGMEEGYTYVDLGLSVEWATRNVGAERREAYGDYFAWGETQTKNNYAWDSYRWGIASDLLTKYCVDAAHGKNGATDGKTTLDLTDDAARVQWKGAWRMPTLAEQKELREKCTWKWKNLNGIAGYEVTGPSGKSIFLPAAGFKNNDALYQQGSYGCYWSSNLYEIQSDYAYYLNIIPSTREQGQYSRSYGYSVRPVYLTYYCVRFDANQGEGKMDSVMVKKTESLTIPANQFTRDGYIFTAWNTAPDGSGTKVAVQSKFLPTSDTTFYAQWEIIKYKLSFNANGGTGTMSDQIFEYGAANTINANLFIREGFIFTSWNTQANASGTAYTDKQSITLTENATLYAQWKRKTYTLTFDANGGKGTMDQQIFEHGIEQQLKANEFTREGYVFAGWNTKADGSGTNYSNKQVVTLTEDITLYAQWEIIKYKLSFNANGGTGTMSDQIFEYGAANTINANSFIREGFIFTGWNTQANGSGTAYTEKQSITLTENTTLYAQWKRKTYTLTFDANGGKGTMDQQIFEHGIEQQLKANEFTREGYVFAGWNTKFDGSGTSYSNQQKLTIKGDLRLYAQWRELHSVSFDANGGEGTMNPQIFEHGIEQHLKANTFTREGYVFAGWNTKADGSGTNYSNKQVVTLTEDLTLYAQWELRFYVSFEANGGHGEMEVQTFVQGETKALLACAYTNSGYIFTGWNTAANGSGTAYTDKQSITLTQDVTLYAQWERIKYNLSFDANGGEGTMAAQTFEAGVSQAIEANTFTRDGYVFNGWNAKADGSGKSYSDKQSITLTQDITLYAQWQVVSGTENGHDYVDFGLPSGLKWATCNIGATTPEDYGDYFAWGETSPKDNYDWSTYKYCNGSFYNMTKYCTDSYYGTVDNKTTLDFSDDVARANWGGTWRMPTRAELDELRNNCIWTWTTQNGVNGYKVTSKTNGNSIFLPAAGYRHGTSVSYVGSYGSYWSSSLYEIYPNGAYYLYFYSGNVDWDYSRSSGRTVRAVCP